MPELYYRACFEQIHSPKKTDNYPIYLFNYIQTSNLENLATFVAKKYKYNPYEKKYLFVSVFDK